MMVRFLGPVGKVTGSCTWLWDDDRGWNFLVDCGMQQGEPTAAQWNKLEVPFDPRTIQFVVLTHAHIDHCGLLPLLYRKGFHGSVYCSRETARIAALLLKDAARLGGVEYSEADVDLIQWHEPGSGQLLGKFHPVAEDLFLRFFRAGHVVGALSVAVHWGPPRRGEQRSIAFSGDLGPNAEDRESLPFLRHRMGVPGCDFAVVESTYGGKVRPSIDQDPAARRERLRALLDRAIDRSGVLLIPAFSYGRTQDVLFDLHWLAAASPERYGAIPLYLDSPGARQINRVFLEALERTECNGSKGKVRPLWLGKQMFAWFGLDDRNADHVKRVIDICKITLGHQQDVGGVARDQGNAFARSWKSVMRTPANREHLAEKLETAGPAVLVVSSGTCDGGPAAFWLPKLLGSDRHTVALAGFCSPTTIGGRLLALAAVPDQERSRLSESLHWKDGAEFALAAVRAGIAQLDGYSAHADQTGLVDWLFGSHAGQTVAAGKIVFIQHGTDANRTALQAAIATRAAAEYVSLQSVLPRWQSTYDLDQAGVEIPSAEEMAALEEKIAELQERRRRLGGR
ncbi:MBL fold metallo-hydrolase [Ramlibacter sp. XY19]|uniref:MBL fold metallo-hydrolase n=1 Tax=Ramlibacter paludis TaxID=2908000 RepID=UPI0023DCDD97|nr:MBL fold metallo-hydrolase [Ramlibacter paludis]MCG2594581.1 MBL fold metallo-hydrolase [Ramlibacter paludis]